MMKDNKSSLRKLTKHLKVISLAVMILTANRMYGQEPVKKERNSDEVFVVVVDKLPEFPVGTSGLMNWIGANNLYPPLANEERIEGEVAVNFILVEKYPEFPGGATGLNNFLRENLKYPIEAQKNKIEGRVITKFIVNKDGSLSDIKIEHGVHPLLDAEAIRVISIMPKWRPGIQRGKPVKVSFKLPVVFSLSNNNDDKEEEIEDSKIDEDEVLIVVEQQPEFPGGVKLLMKYLAVNVKYPVEAMKRGIQGRVVVNFIVQKDGSISDVKVEKRVDPLLDAEAIRVISMMPNWIAGEQDGKAVNVRFSLPVIFRLGKTITIKNR